MGTPRSMQHKASRSEGNRKHSHAEEPDASLTKALWTIRNGPSGWKLIDQLE
jgi:hypothetical protein